MKEEKEQGIVLKTLEYKERQRIITLFTPSHGKISLIAKGLSRKKPHLLVATSPFCLAEFVYRKGRSELFQLCEASVLEEHSFLRRDLSRLQTAAEMVQLLLQTQWPEKPAPLLFSLFLTFLNGLQHAQDPSVFYASFQLKLLKHEGLLAWPLEETRFSQEEQALLGTLVNTRSLQTLQQLLLPPTAAQKISVFVKDRLTETT